MGNNLGEHFPQTRRSHDRNLVKACLPTINCSVLEKIIQLTCYQNKFVFKSKDLKFSGENLIQGEYNVDPKKVQAITNETNTESSRYSELLGTTLLSQLFQSKVSRADSTTLRALSKSDTFYTWESSQQAAFDIIQKKVTNVPILAYFDEFKPSIIQLDTFKRLGGVLLQDGKPVVYASRSLTETEQHYSNI